MGTRLYGVYDHLVLNMPINEIYLDPMSNGDINSKFGDMAAKIALQNFDYRYATLLFFNSSLYYGVEVFLRVFNKSIFVNKGVINSKFIQNSRQYVIFGSDIVDLEQLLEAFKDMDIKTNGKFIIICESQESNDCDEKTMTKLFWEYRIVDVVLIKYMDEQVHGYTYFPISNGECNNVTPVKICSSNYGKRLTTNQGEIFGMKLKKLNFCPLFISTFLQTPYFNLRNGIPSGADGELIPVIAYALNTSLEIRFPHRGDGWGFRHKNGTWMGSLADIYDDLANLSMTSAALTLTRFSDFHISRSYHTTHVVWVTHPAAMQNEASKLLHPFTYSTRIALISSYLLVILCAFIIRTDMWSFIYRKTEQEQSYMKSVVFYSWMICMGQAVVKLPPKSMLLYITFLWIYYCFMIRTVYQVYLISSLKGTFYEEQIDSIEDAIKAKYPFGGGLALQDYFIDQPEVYKNWINVEASQMFPIILNMSKGMKFVLAMNAATAKLSIKKYKVNLHILPQNIVSSPAVIFFKRHSPFIESINEVLSKLVASGLPDMLVKKYTSVPSDFNENGSSQETLKIVHFSACYAVLLIGWVVSALFFLLELYFGKFYRHPVNSHH